MGCGCGKIVNTNAVQNRDGTFTDRGKTIIVVCDACTFGDGKGSCKYGNKFTYLQSECPIGKFKNNSNLYVWPTVHNKIPDKYRLRWYGSPMPLRLLFLLKYHRWPSGQMGCGCIKPLKDAWNKFVANIFIFLQFTEIVRYKPRQKDIIYSICKAFSPWFIYNTTGSTNKPRKAGNIWPTRQQ